MFALSGALLASSPSGAKADGGTVRASVRKGPWQVTVFTSPTPLRAGPIDVSVLVQDAATGRPAPDVRVWVRATPRNTPTVPIVQQATTDAATNKLLLAAVFELPNQGWSEFRVEVQGGGRSEEVAFELEAGEALPRWVAFAGWIALPAVGVVLFAAHQFLVRWKKSRGRSEASGGA